MTDKWYFVKAPMLLKEGGPLEERGVRGGEAESHIASYFPEDWAGSTMEEEVNTATCKGRAM